MNQIAYIDANLVSSVAEMIRDMLGEDYDDQTFLDSLDGETDAMDVLGRLILHRQEAQESAKAMKVVADNYTARARRMSAGADACTAAMGKLLDAMQTQKVPHPLGTVSRTKPRTRAVVDNEDAVPTQLRKWTVDLAAVKAQLEAGEEVPGASLVAGEPGISVRVK